MVGQGVNRCGIKIPEDVVVGSGRGRPRQMVIAHRGASYHLPEHSLEAYRLAMEQGADYVEIDLVLTSDGVFVALHSIDLNVTTNVATVFPQRLSDRNGKQGYWVNTFTFAELQQLRINQRLPEGRSTDFDGSFKIPRLGQILDLWNEYNAQIKPTVSNAIRRVGLYIEVKDADYFEREVQFSNNNTVAEELIHHLYLTDHHSTIPLEDDACAQLKYGEYLVPNLILENFRGSFLEEVADKWISVYNITSIPIPPMVLLVPEDDCFKEQYWYQVGKWTTFLSGIAPDKECLTGSKWREFMEPAWEHELAVHSWTERPELRFVDNAFASMEREIDHLICTVGVDGLFVEDITNALIQTERTCAQDEATLEPTVSPTSHPNQQEQQEQQQQQQEGGSSYKGHGECLSTEDTTFMGLAAGAMGLLVGSIATYWISQSRLCKSRRHRHRQLRIPTHDDIEMI